MEIHLSEDAARVVRSQVESGRFRSEEEVVATALSLLDPVPQRPPVAITEEEFERRLVESGFLSRSYGPRPDRPKVWSFTPITIEGEPLSETIIRERG